MEAATASIAVRKSSSLVDSDAPAVLSRNYSRGGAVASSRTYWRTICKASGWNSVFEDPDVWLLCVVCVLDLANERASLVRYEFNDADGNAGPWGAFYRRHVCNGRLALG